LKDDQYFNLLKEIAFSLNFLWKDKTRLIVIHILNLWCNNKWPNSENILKIFNKTKHLSDQRETFLKITLNIQNESDFNIFNIFNIDFRNEKKFSNLIENLENKIDICGIPEIAIDKHTVRGRNLNKGLKDL